MAIYIDTKRCMNCRACEIACKLENNLPAGPRYTMVVESDFTTEDGRDKSEFLPMPCLHCGEPACTKACPTGAVYKRVDGIVVVNQSKCIGCRECLWACPFGVPQFGSDGKMQKCNMCLHRLENNEIPACARACNAEAIKVGTVEEISAYVREKYAQASRNKLADIIVNE